MRKLILAFDAGCAVCRDMASNVQREAGTAIAVRSLRDPDVRRHRAHALGPDAPWRPTLIEVDDAAVRAWTGSVMSARLIRRIGPGRAIRVARAILGDLMPAGSERRIVRRLAPRLAVGVFLLTGGTAFADVLKQAGSGDAADLMRTKLRVSPADLTIVLNEENAEQVLISSAASTPARELLDRLRGRGFMVGDRNAKKVTFAIDRQDPAGDPVFDMVGADLSVDGMTTGGYCHVMGSNGDIALAIISHPDGTTEAVYNTVDGLGHTVLGQDGTMPHSSPPAASTGDKALDPDVLSCFPLCEGIGAADSGPTVPECLRSCLTVSVVARWAGLTHGDTARLMPP